MATTTKKISLPLRLCLALYIVSVLFKIMYWPFHRELALVSVIGLLLFYSFRYHNKVNKTFIDHLKSIFVLSWSLMAINGYLYIITLPAIFNLLPYAILIWLLITRSISYSELLGELKLKGIYKGVYTAVFFASVGSIFLSVLFKIMHWQFAPLLLILGFIVFSIIIVLDYFIRDYPVDENEIDSIGKN